MRMQDATAVAKNPACPRVPLTLESNVDFTLRTRPTFIKSRRLNTIITRPTIIIFPENNNLIGATNLI